MNNFALLIFVIVAGAMLDGCGFPFGHASGRNRNDCSGEMKPDTDKDCAAGRDSSASIQDTARDAGDTSPCAAADAGDSSMDTVTTDPAAARRHVLVMIGDGMQLAHEIAGSRYLYGTDWGLSFHGFPVMTYQATWDVNVYNIHATAAGMPAFYPDAFDWTLGYDPALGGADPYPIRADDETSLAYFRSGGWPHPDSASTATAMSTGIKTYATAVGWSIGNMPLIHVSEMLRDHNDMSVGLISTVPISHATPAGFFAHNPSRGNTADITEEILLQTKPEVVIGGGFNNAGYIRDVDLQRAVGTGEWVTAFPAAGADENDTLLAAAVRANQEHKRLLGLFDGGDRPSFPAPVPSDTPGSPTIDVSALGRPLLSTAAIAAMEVLSRDPDGFFLVIEQGNIDWANHNGNFASMVGCVWEFDQAVRAVVNFVDRPDDEMDWSNTTILVTADHANGFMRFGKTLGRGDLPRMVVDNTTGINLNTYPDGEVTYAAQGSHTLELVDVYVKGFAAKKVREYENTYPGSRIIDNTAIHHLVVEASKHN